MYPDDIDPQSQCRLPLPRRDELDAEGQRIYDSLADPQGASLRGLRGPGGIHLHSPALASHTRPLNHYLRHEAELGGRLRELAILVTARELDSQFEWAAHEAEARREGLSPEIIETVRHRRDTGGLAEGDAVVIELGREIFTARKVAQLGQAGCGGWTSSALSAGSEQGRTDPGARAGTGGAPAGRAAQLMVEEITTG